MKARRKITAYYEGNKPFTTRKENAMSNKNNENIIEVENQAEDSKQSLPKRGVAFAKRHAKGMLIGAGTALGLLIAGGAAILLSKSDDAEDSEVEIETEVEIEVPFDSDDSDAEEE